MEYLQSPIVKAAIGGALAALLVDLRAWSQAPEGQAFNVKKAVIRWVYGGLAAGLAAVGLGQLS